MNEENLQVSLQEDKETQTEIIVQDSVETEKDVEQIDIQIVEDITKVPTADISEGFATPTILVDGITYSYYDVSYQAQLQTNLYLLLILISIVTIFVCTRFYRFFRSIFNVKLF